MKWGVNGGSAGLISQLGTTKTMKNLNQGSWSLG